MKKFAVLGKKKRTKYPTWVLIAENVTEDEAQHIKCINRRELPTTEVTSFSDAINKFQDIIITER